MNVLVFTSLYPNALFPLHGVFVKERMERVACLPDTHMQVVAPVPYFPRIKWSHRYKYSQVPLTEMVNGIPIYHPRYFITPKVGMTLYGLEMFLSVLPMVRELRKRFPFELIDAHYVYPDGFAAWLLSRVFKVSLVLSARGSDINLFKELVLIRPLLKLALTKADKVIAVSASLQQAMVGVGVSPDHITVIPNGIDMKKFSPLKKEDARRELGLHDRPTILSVGHLTANKGFDLIITAVDILTRKNQRALQLVIVGDGMHRSTLSRLVCHLGLKDRVTFAGAVPHNDLQLWYSAGDVFCLASEHEGMPNVVLEALACGLPVVASKAGGIPEIITSEKVGFLAERTPQSFADNIAKALGKSWDRAGISRSVSGRTWDRVAESVRSVFDGVVEGSQRSSPNCELAKSTLRQ